MADPLPPAHPAHARQKLSDARAAIWARNLPILEQRLALLERAASTSPLPDDLRVEACAIAHQLSGSLGMFDLPRGTVIARDLEQLLQQPGPDSGALAALTRQLREIVFPAS